MADHRLAVMAPRRGAMLVDRLVIGAGFDHRGSRRDRLRDHDGPAAAARPIAVTLAVAIAVTVAVARMRGRGRGHVPDRAAASPAAAVVPAVSDHPNDPVAVPVMV